MKEIDNYIEIQELIEKEDLFLLYASMPNCSVCHSDYPKVKKLCQDLTFPSYKVDLSKVPQAAGQLSLLSAPGVLVFYKGKEWHRQARIINFQELKKRILELQGA